MRTKSKILLAFLLLCTILTFVCKSYFDKQNSLSNEIFQTAMTYFAANKSQFKNQDYISVIDYSKPSYYKRFHIVHLQSGEISSYLVAHGSGRKSKGKSLYPPSFSNVPKSLLSSLGMVRTGEIYQGKYGRSLRLDGLQKGSNENMRKRAIVLHKASYVSYQAVWRNLLGSFTPRIGETWGCPAVHGDYIDEVIDMIEGGSLIYIHSN